jgi:hypothetical protein
MISFSSFNLFYPSQSIDVIHLEGMQYINIDLTTPQGIQHAKEVNFITGTTISNLVVKSALFTPVLNELFISVDSNTKPPRQAKTFTVFRHPIERHTSEFYYLQSASHEGSYRQFFTNWTIDQWAQSHYIGENWMTRMLVNKHMGGRLNDDDLILAKNILQSKFLVGLTSQMAESMRRIQQYFQWDLPTYLPNHRPPQSGQDCYEQFYGETARKKINTNPHPKVLPKTDTWYILERVNNYDLPLYEFAIQLFGQQAQLFPK